MGSAQVNKGKRGERIVARKLRDAGYMAERTSVLQARGVAQLPGDVTVFGKNDTEWSQDRWVAIECKLGEAVKIHTQALKDAMNQFGNGAGCVMWKTQSQKKWSLSCWSYGLIATFDADAVLSGTDDLGRWLAHEGWGQKL